MSTTFQDFYLQENQAFGSVGLGHPVTELDTNVWRPLYDRCSHVSESEKTCEFDIEHEERRYRVSRIDDMDCPAYVLRYIEPTIPSVDRLDKNYVSKVTTPRNLTGLIPICGAFGQGKTTTAIALILERLRVHGGVCVTLEDPVEHKITGLHGKGVVYQTHLGNDAAEMVKRSMRWSASILFVGEIRTPLLAAEVVRASLMGTLVFCTIHAGSIEAALERLFALTQAGFGSANEASSALSACLTAVWHQKLVGDPPRADLSFLNIGSVGGGDEKSNMNMGVRQMIRERQFFQLGSEIARQKTLIRSMS